MAFTVPVPPDGTASVTITNHAMLRVGDELTTLSTWTGEPAPGGAPTNYRKLIIGRVASINSGTGAIGLMRVPKSFVSGSYNVYSYELPYIRQITIGTTTSASTSVTGVNRQPGG